MVSGWAVDGVMGHLVACRCPDFSRVLVGQSVPLSEFDAALVAMSRATTLDSQLVSTALTNSLRVRTRAGSPRNSYGN